MGFVHMFAHVDEKPQIYEDVELLQPREPLWKEHSVEF